MFLKLFSSIMLIIALNCHADNCRLVSDSVPVFVENIGSYGIASFANESIAFKPSHGDIHTVFNMDHLHKITRDGEDYYFRYHWYSFENGQTILNNVTWLDNHKPKCCGLYYFSDYQTAKTPVKGQTMVTIGDSISWSNDGRYLRCMLVNQGIDYDFIGEHVDTFGFAHDAEGGDTTQAVLNRIASIPIADSYFILLGTNDISLTAMQTVNNLMTIAYTLKAKNPNTVIYISTLLPRHETHMSRILQVNSILKANNWGVNIKIIDVGGFVYSQSNWLNFFHSDQLHPNYYGYLLITWKIINAIYF